MRAAGLREIDRAKADGRWERAYAAASTATVPDDLRAALARNKKAAAFFETLDAKNCYAILHRTHNAKKAETRAAQDRKIRRDAGQGRDDPPAKGVQAEEKAGQEMRGREGPKNPCISLSFAAFGATSPAVSRPPHPWRLAAN